ncbi:Bulb-type lectin domain-containing protein [Plasmodiophora brassicae]
MGRWTCGLLQPALALLLLSTAIASGFDEEDLDAFDETYGSSYLSSEAAEYLASTDGDKNQIIAELDQLETDLRQDEIDARAALKDFLAQQQALIAKATASIADLQKQQVAVTNDIATAKAGLQKTQTALADDKHQLQVLQADIDTKNNERKQTDARCATDLQQLADSISGNQASIKAIQTLIAMLDKITFKEALLELIAIRESGMMLHEDAAGEVAEILDAVDEMDDSEDPTKENATKTELLNLLQALINGLTASMQQHQAQMAQEKAHCAELDQAIGVVLAQFGTNVAALQKRLDQDNVDLRNLQAQLAQLQAKLESTNADLANQNQYIAKIKDGINARQNAYNAQIEALHNNLDALEAARAYVIANFAGTTTANTCVPTKTGCNRCLYDEQCHEGQSCAAVGVCNDASTKAPAATAAPTAAPAPAYATVAPGIDRIQTGQMLLPGQYIINLPNHGTQHYKLVMQPDCNLVEFGKLGGRDYAFWSTNTANRGTDCRFVITNSNMAVVTGAGQTVWSWNGPANAQLPAVLVMQGDGNLVMYTHDGRPVWATETWHYGDGPWMLLKLQNSVAESSL